MTEIRDRDLSPAMHRILAQVQRYGVRRYTARSRAPVRRLESLGLVAVDWPAGPAGRITVTLPGQEEEGTP